VNQYLHDPIRVYLLGSLEVARENKLLRPEGWARRKAAALFARLAYERRLHKEQAMDFLWPESSLPAGANNLYRTIHSLRQTLDTALGPDTAAAIFSFRDGILRLNESVWIDVEAFEASSRPVPDESPGQRINRLEQALSIYRGDLLVDDPYSEWTLAPRERLYRQQRDIRLALAFHQAASSDYSAAAALLGPLLSRDPADEQVHRELMRLYALSGQRSEALRQYQLCVEALATELGLEPAAETTAVYQQIRDELISPIAAALIPAPTGGYSHLSMPPTTDRSRPLFVGRERELSLLQSHLDEAIDGRGGILFVTGEAGQGKTTLMTEFAYRALRANPQLVVAAGACQALIGISDPYLPFRDLMTLLAGDWQRPWLGGDMSIAHIRRLQAIAPQTAEAIATYAPDLIDTLVPAALLSQRPGSGSRVLDQRQIFDQMGQLLRALARQQPLLLLLDDLQWADTASTNLLFYLGRQLVNSAVLIIGAYRPSEISHTADAPPPLAEVVHELVRYHGDIQIDLGRFIPAERRHFVDALLDSEPNRLDASFREAMFQRTKGHPLFSVELLRALQEQGELAQDDTGMWTARPNLDWDILPARVEAVIKRRVERLPHELRQLLAVASVEGESFSVEVLAQVQSLAIRSLLHQLSQELNQRYRLVREQADLVVAGRILTRYQFRHALFQEYLYHRLSAAERRHLHGEVAAALEHIVGDDPEGLAVSLAHHYLAAGDTARAVPHLWRAGDEARRRVALEEAIQFYESALTYGPADNPAAQAEILHKLGESLFVIGKLQEAIDRFSAAEDLYAQARIRTGIGAVQRMAGRVYWEQGKRAEALRYYQRALATLEQEPESAELARAISGISQMHMLADEYDKAIAWGERALSLARAADTEDVVLHALTSVGVSRVARGEAERGLAMLLESLERAEALRRPHDVFRAFAGLGDSLVSLERYDEAQAIYERMLAYGRKVQAVMGEGVALVQLGYLDWWAGRWRQAWALRQEIMDWMATFPGASFAKVWASNFLGLLYNDVGQSEKARAVLAEYAAVARSAHEPQTTVPHLGQLARCAQTQTKMAEFVQEILTLIDSTTYPRYETLPALRLACGWLAQSSGGDPAAFYRLEKAHMQMPNLQSAASLYEVRAVAAGIRGEWESAVSHYKVAVENWQALQRPYDLLRTLAGLQEALTDTGDTAAMYVVRQQATSLVEQLASELVEPEIRRSFLASPLVIGIRRR
jgi:DNA-binding SARP family transcriptional activator